MDNEEQEIEEVSDTGSSNSDRGYIPADSNNSNNPQSTSDVPDANTFGIHAPYHGDGWFYNKNYDGTTITNASFGRTIPIADEVITDADYAYLNVADMGNIVDEYRQDYFTTSGKTITEALEQLNNVHKGLTEAGYFYGKHPEGEAPLVGDGGIIDLMQQFQTVKTQMDPDYIEQATDAYNDDLEAAKGLQYKNYLKKCCKAYNDDPNRKVLTLYMDFQQQQYQDVTNADGSITSEPCGYSSYGTECNNYGYYDESEGGGWVDGNPLHDEVPSNAAEGSTWDVNGGNARVEVRERILDSIDYQFGFEDWNGIIDSIWHDTDDLERKLSCRSLNYTKLEPRPGYSYYGS